MNNQPNNQNNQRLFQRPRVGSPVPPALAADYHTVMASFRHLVVVTNETLAALPSVHDRAEQIGMMHNVLTMAVGLHQQTRNIIERAEAIENANNQVDSPVPKMSRGS